MRHEERIEVFDELRVRYLPFLTGVLWKLSGDREIFGEAMQYVLMGLWQHVEKLAGSKGQSYVYRIALSANARAWRQRIGRDRRAVAAEIESREGSEPQLDPADVRQAIASLPVRQGKAVVMRYLEQQDYPTIAAALGCPEATARSHVSKAVAALRDLLVTRMQLNRE